MRIYLTHCSYHKDDSLKGTSKAVLPEQLYTSEALQRFVTRCKQKNVQWAIFSDLYGVWFPDERHGWYEKSPGSVTNKEFAALVSDFDAKLAKYDEIFFYYNPGRFHPLYARLLKSSKLAGRIKEISHVSDIEGDILVI